MKEANSRFCAAKPALKRREPNTPRSMSGLSKRFWRTMNAAHTATPATSGIHTYGLLREKDDALLKPSSTPPRPKVDKISEPASRRAEASCGFEGLTSARAHSVNTQVNAARRTKKLRQPHADAIAPPTVGPILGAKPMATPAMPIAVA